MVVEDVAARKIVGTATLLVEVRAVRARLPCAVRTQASARATVLVTSEFSAIRALAAFRVFRARREITSHHPCAAPAGSTSFCAADIFVGI